MARFQVHDDCVVIGDNGSAGHKFLNGTPVRLVKVDPRNGNLWYCRSEVDDERWWVWEEDLEPVDQGPTEEEILALFNVQTPVQPQPCVTCGCTCKTNQED